MKSADFTWPTVLAAVLAVAVTGSCWSPERDDAAAESLGWRLSLQCWTFNHVTTFESIDWAKSLGIRYIELYPGQKLRPDSDAKTGHEMSGADRDLLIAKLKEAGIRPVNYGVVGLSGNDADDRKVFDFAKALGIETINSEPTPESLTAIEKLANEYKVNVALHNHPKPSRYWDPQVAYDAVRSHGPRIGLCADTGHWLRSGIDPLEALRKYGDRILTFHFKDLNEFNKLDAHDVPWGTGVGKTKELLAALKNAKFKGALSIEYEDHPKDQFTCVGACVSAFDRFAKELADKK